MKRIILNLLLLLALLLVLASNVDAMTSTNYRLDWFNPLTGAGGGPMSSPNFRADVTVGQTAIGTESSMNYRVGLGFWYGATTCYLLPCKLSLPLIMR